MLQGNIWLSQMACSIHEKQILLQGCLCFIVGCSPEMEFEEAGEATFLCLISLKNGCLGWSSIMYTVHCMVFWGVTKE